MYSIHCIHPFVVNLFDVVEINCLHMEGALWKIIGKVALYNKIELV